MPKHQRITIRELYPDFTDKELKEAEANLKRYVQILWRIHERLKAEGMPLPSLSGDSARDLTVPAGSSSIPTERSNTQKNINS
jgi:hypothetical protein